jgi:hypothetical protein
MAFLKKYSYIIIKLFLNQFAISLFGVALAFACSRAENDKLLLLTSIFAVLFYLFLEYAVIWEVGAKDGISATARHTSRGLWRGFVISLCANALNFLVTLLVLTKLFTGGDNPVSAVAQFVAMMLQGMYQGILSQFVGGVQLHTLPWMFVVILLPAVIVTGVGYIIGNYNLHATNILIPKNKDVKNNGRPID